MKLYFDLVGNKDYVPDEDSSVFTQQISTSVENTIDLLENLLVWAQTQIKGIEPHPMELNIYEITANIMALLGGNAHQKGLILRNETQPNHTLNADADMINLVIRNLISNAIKFTNDGGTISVRSTIDNAQLKIEVADTGVGISEGAVQNLFTKSANPTTLGTANEKGTGLGLILCKEFVEKNGGSISVSSQQQVGSVFTLVFPIKTNESSYS